MNILYFNRPISKDFDKEINFNNRDIRRLFKDNFKSSRLLFIEFRELIVNIFPTDDVLLIRSKANKTHIYYRDYNKFSWNFGNPKTVEYTGGLSKDLLTTNSSITKVGPGHIVVGNVKEKSYNLECLQDFWEINTELSNVVREVCFNIYYYEYINPQETINIYSYF